MDSRIRMLKEIASLMVKVVVVDFEVFVKCFHDKEKKKSIGSLFLPLSKALC